MKTLKRNNDIYTIEEFDSSTWIRVYKNEKPLALVMGCEMARQVVWKDSGRGDYITEEMFI